MANFPYLPYPTYCPDCGQPIPQGQTCPCFAGQPAVGTEQEIKSFLAQFEEAPKRISEWPQWMQDAAYEAAATFPKPPGNAGVAVPRKGQQ